MKLKSLGLLLGSLCLLCACSNDSSSSSEIKEPLIDGDVFVTLNIVEAPGSRADNGTPTSSEQTEAATNDESAIKNVVLIVAQDADNIICTAYTTPNDQNKLIFNINGNDFTGLTQNVKLYAVCNITEENYMTAKSAGSPSKMIQKILTYSQDNDSYWSETSGFLMSSSSEGSASLDIPGIRNGKYTSESPLDLGTISVQRAMARIDLSKSQPDQNELMSKDIKVKFDGVGLVNLSKKFFLYKEVGTSSTGFDLFAPETTVNYVNDPKALLGVYTDDELLYRVDGKKDIKSLYEQKTYSWFDSPEKDYEFLRYLTPNTVTDYKNQLAGKTTGLIFKAEILKEDESALDNVTGGGDLYVYYDKVIGNENYLKSLKDNANGELANVYNQYLEAVTGKTDDNSKKTSLQAAGFTLYPSENGKYYCYYTYWVRHNGIGKSNDGVMNTPMEFGVVRNNVYKIAVKSVKGLGFPSTFMPQVGDENDPEQQPSVTNTNLEVEVEVKPWIKRVDDVEF